MRKTIPKFVITAVAFLALPRVYGVEPSHYFHQVVQRRTWSVAKDLLHRRVHTARRIAIKTTLGKQNAEELPLDIISVINDFAVGLTVHEETQKALTSVFKKIAYAITTTDQKGFEKIAGKIAKEVTEFLYGFPIEFAIHPSDASPLLFHMVS